MLNASKGWLVNDLLTTIPGTRTLWHELRDELGLEDCTGTMFPNLAQVVESKLREGKPPFIIRNGTWFGPINTDVPQIALIQDVLQGYARARQVQVGRGCRVVVFNSEYTKSFYPELSEGQVISRVIPLGIDPEMFCIQPAKASRAVLFIGSQDWIKGFDLLERLVKETPYNFVCVMKDAPFEHARVTCHTKLSHAELVPIINSARLGVCLSRIETQHLAGLEMGMCGVPLLTTNVGAYFNREPGVWGRQFVPERSPVEDLALAMSNPRPTPQNVREYWLERGFDTASCMKAWKEAVATCLS